MNGGVTNLNKFVINDWAPKEKEEEIVKGIKSKKKISMLNEKDLQEEQE